VTLTAQGRRLRRDVAWNLVPVALLGIVGLGLSFVIARWWGPAAFAVFNLVTTAYFVFGVVGACGLQYSVLRAIAERPDDRDRVATVVVGALVPGVVLAAACTAVFLAIRPLFARWLDSAAVAEGMLWAAPGLFCFTLNKLLFGVVNGLRRMRAFAIYTSLRYVMVAVGLGLARAEQLAAAHLPAIWTVTEATMLVVLTGELLATVQLRRAAGWIAWARTHLAYGVRGVLATVAYEINNKLDVWLLGVLVGNKDAVGVYALAAALNDGVMHLAVALQNNIDPVIARLIAGGERAELHAMIARTRRWFVPALAGICAASAVMFSPVIPRLIGDPTFVAGAAPFAILMAGLALASPYLPFAHLLLMAQRPGWHTVLLVTMIAVNVTANVTLIPRLGLTGAALSMAATVVTAALLLRGLARWRLEIQL
jgi:O-antigen/teichoic acid export membrane protein